jgi:hypothetical protein
LGSLPVCNHELQEMPSKHDTPHMLHIEHACVNAHQVLFHAIASQNQLASSKPDVHLPKW